MPGSIRGDISKHTNRRKGQTLSGTSAGYEVKRTCPANIRANGYEPCGREMWWSRKLKAFVCDVHGEMKT